MISDAEYSEHLALHASLEMQNGKIDILTLKYNEKIVWIKGSELQLTEMI